MSQKTLQELRVRRHWCDIANKILDAANNNPGPRDEKLISSLWRQLKESGADYAFLRTIQRDAGIEDASLDDLDNPFKYNGVGAPIDWEHLVKEGSAREVGDYLFSFDSYKRTAPLSLLMSFFPPRRRLEVFLEWGNKCDAPRAYRSPLAGSLRDALTKVALIEVLGPKELTFYTALPDQMPIWRGCERGRERGLSWTTDRVVAEGFACGKRCINTHPTVAAAVIPKQHVLGVFLSRGESELAVDPRRLRKLCAEPYAVA
jgi:hypothetical protein